MSPKEHLEHLKRLKVKAKSAIDAKIKRCVNPDVLKAVAIVQAAARRKAYAKTARQSKGAMQRMAVHVCRLTGPGNTILLPPVNFQAWFKGLTGGATTGYMQTVGLARGIDILFQTARRFGIRIVAVSEPYTSRECSHCRDCDFRSGGRTFTCHMCGMITHRDAANSAVNIMIRAIALGHDVEQALRSIGNLQE